ncbi:MAG: nucleoside hydrolase [Capnocytophaga sp.]|nr:nucleoside hydrolase [Capnocytophaga sp.]
MKRFEFILLCICCFGCTNLFSQVADKFAPARARVIIVNDFSGDPDGLFQLAHHLLSPSVEIRAIIGSHLRPNDPFDNSAVTADNAAKNAQELVDLMFPSSEIKVLAGSNSGLKDVKTPAPSKGADFIIQEALRTDTDLPLFVVCGAGLTDIASALLQKPEIAKKFTLVWIGGEEYKGINRPPNFSTPEYNLAISIPAAQVVFNHSEVAIWQVPRNAYRQVLMSYAELQTKVKPLGKLGVFLAEKIENLMERTQQFKLFVGETYIQGDNPLVLLTALQSSFEADPSSSFYSVENAPLITEKGSYATNPKGKKIRVYNQLDIRLLLDDFYAKLNLFYKK